MVYHGGWGPGDGGAIACVNVGSYRRGALHVGLF